MFTNGIKRNQIMIKHFLDLEWKQFFRLASVGKSVALKIIMGFFAIYILLTFLALGAGGYFFLEKTFPDKDPFVLVNQFLIFMIISDLIFRYLMQKIPVMDIKPMLLLPIKKSKLVNYVLTKSVFSFFKTPAFSQKFCAKSIKSSMDCSIQTSFLASGSILNFSTSKSSVPPC